MKFGKTQRQIVEYLQRCGPTGGNILNAPNAGLLLGYTIDEVMRSVAALESRGIIRKLSIVRHVLVPIGKPLGDSHE